MFLDRLKLENSNLQLLAGFYNWREVRRVDAVGDEAAAAARGGERQAEEDRGRSVARQGDAAGRHPPKTMRPARKRQMVDQVRAEWQVSDPAGLSRPAG